LKGLAEFVMRGRLQALLVAMTGAGSVMFCWISAAVVALVTLRKGAGSGVWVFIWTLLPAGAMLYAFGDSGPLSLLCGTLALALVLRYTVSLPFAILASVAVGAATGVAMLAFGGQYLEQIAAYFGEFLATLEQQLSQGKEAVTLPRPEARQIAGMLGAGTAMMSALCLLLARYWQATLYNPGGFGEEFKALRYSPAVSLLLVVAALALSSIGLQYRTWAMIFFIPLTFVGLALVHARAELRGQGAGWLAGFYIIWVIFDPVKLVVVFFAIADSWLNFRRRWGGKSGTDLSARSQSEDQDKDKD
jgi:hypothetical protein